MLADSVAISSSECRVQTAAVLCRLQLYEYRPPAALAVRVNALGRDTSLPFSLSTSR